MINVGCSHDAFKVADTQQEASERLEWGIGQRGEPIQTSLMNLKQHQMRDQCIAGGIDE
jgi:hypothetical protein